MSDKDIRRERVVKLKAEAKRAGVSMNQLFERYISDTCDFHNDKDIDTAISRLKKSAQSGRMNISEADITGLFRTLISICEERKDGMVLLPEIDSLIGNGQLKSIIKQVSVQLDKNLETNR